MRIKPGVSLLPLSPQILLALIIVNSVFSKYKVELVITSVADGKHNPKSLHYAGYAVDVRSKHIESDALKQALLEECKEALDTDFDMILEALGKEQEHYHLEFDTK